MKRDLRPLVGDQETRVFETKLIAIEKIKESPTQARSQFNKEDIKGLAESIRSNGILQPLVVKVAQNNSYKLIAGERRLRAAQSIGLKTVPAFIIKVENESEMMELALIENIQRDNLNSIEEAEGYAILSGKFNFTQNEIVKKVSAGNISLHLPHTQLVSVGMGKREGLFGVKMENSFGKLSTSTIIGREKVNKESYSVSGGQGGTVIISA